MVKFSVPVHCEHEKKLGPGRAADLLDVITVDLDGGCITVPENMTVQQVRYLCDRNQRQVVRISEFYNTFCL